MKSFYQNIAVFLALFVFATLNVFAHEPFSFALITDIHIKNENPQAEKDLNSTVKEINNRPEIRFVLVDGDITQNGNLDELVYAKLELDSLKAPYYVTVGNHDVYSDTFIPSANFKMIFKDDKYAFTYNGVQFIGLSTAPAVKFQKGRIADSDFKWLKYKLLDTSDSTIVFLATHYPFQSGDVENDSAATALLKKHGVNFVLNGHYHRNALFNYNGIPGIVSRPVERRNDGSSGYTIFKVENDELHVFEKQLNEPESEWLTLPLKTEQ